MCPPRSREGDFKCLEDTAATLHNLLLVDEGKRDLDEQFRNREVGHHRYFLHPYKRVEEEWAQMFEMNRLIALPKIVQDDLNKTIHTASFMGLLPEINRAWISIDNKIMFWNYLAPNEIDRYDGLSEVVLSVALSSPKPGVFLDTVKYLIVVSTTIEVVILAVSWDENGNNLKIIPTSYAIPSDNVPMVKIVGSQCGRIFMGGQDGNLYELSYENTENKWASLLGVEHSTHKCQKVNHNAWGIKSILPPFLRSLIVVEESIKDLVVDDVRHFVYAVTSANNLKVAFLGLDNKSTIFLVHSLDFHSAVRNFLATVGRSYDSVPKLESFQEKDSVNIVGLFVVPVTESRNVHAVAVLENGVRVYLQISAWSDIRRTFGPIQPSIIANNLIDAKVEVVFVRGPPTADTLKDVKAINGGASFAVDGYLPSNGSTSAGSTKITSSYYGSGVFLTAVRNKDDLLPDELLAIGEDLVNRKTTAVNAPTSAGRYETPLPSLRESVSLVNTIEGRSVVNYKIFDIKESCRYIHSPQIEPLMALYFTSATPVASEIKERSSIQYLPSRTSEQPSCSPLFFSNNIASFGRDNTMGILPANSSALTPLSEFVTQSMACFTQRQFLCLTRFGLVVLVKSRPLDYLVKSLLSGDGNVDSATNFNHIDEFFKHFGHIESCAMCLDIICGVPHDLNGNLGSDTNTFASNSKVLQERARFVLLRFGGKPDFETLGRGYSVEMTNRDNRLTAGTLTPTFSYSYSHDAIQVTFSRLLRPIWLKPVVESKQLSPIWTSWLLSSMRQAIDQFKQLLEDLYPEAVKRENSGSGNISGTDNKETTHRERELFLSDFQGDFVTERLAQQQTKAAVDPVRQFEKEAYDREYTSINRCWRLISRAGQALNLLQILLVLAQSHKIKLDWSELGDISFRSMVISSTVHDKLKRFLLSLINQLSKSLDRRNEAVLDDITQKLSDNCYLYFSAGDRYAYEVSKHVESIRQELASNTTGLPKGVMKSKMDGLVYLLIKASKYWVSLDDVIDLNGKKSLLTTYCELLSQLGSSGRLGIVQLCLRTANNFIENKSLKSVDESGKVVFNESSSWDRQLYHFGIVLSENQKKEATEACYGCIIHYLTNAISLSKSSTDLQAELISIPELVDAILDGSSDANLRSLVFSVLLKFDFDTLLRLTAIDVEEFLKRVDSQFNHEYLYRYYDYHERHQEAANYMYSLAHLEDVEISIFSRMQFLKQAVVSAAHTCEYQSSSVGANDSVPAYANFLVELKDEVVIAEFQLEAFAELKSLTNEMTQRLQQGNGQGKETLENMCLSLRLLENKLLSISSLFNDIALPYHLWNLALCLMYHSGLEAQDAAKKLWKSILFRNIPLEASTVEGKAFLLLQRGGDIFVDSWHQKREGVFEDSNEWILDFESTVLATANRLFSLSDVPRISFCDLLLEELEDIVSELAACHNPLGKGWAARLLLKLNAFSHSLVVELYVRHLDRCKGLSPEKIVHGLVSLTFTLSKWVSLAYERNRSDEMERMLLVQAIRSGSIHEWLSKLDRQVNAVKASVGRLDRRNISVVNEVTEAILNLRKMIADLTFV